MLGGIQVYTWQQKTPLEAAIASAARIDSVIAVPGDTIETKPLMYSGYGSLW